MPQRVAEKPTSTPVHLAWLDGLPRDLRDAITVDAGRAVPANAHTSETSLYILVSGLCMIVCGAGTAQRRILKIICPGDVVLTSALPALPGMRFVAAQDSQIFKLKMRDLDAAVQNRPQLLSAIIAQCAKSERRNLFLLNTLGALKAEARVAALFIELSLRLQLKPGDQSGFQMPLSRRDIADHLALNADTLSRIISRFKSEGVCHQTGRDKIFIKDWRALLRRCPISSVLIAEHEM